MTMDAISSPLCFKLAWGSDAIKPASLWDWSPNNRPTEVLGSNILPARVFISGSTGLIGYHLVETMVANGHSVLGYDGITD